MQYVEIIGDLDAELVQGLGDFLAAEGGQALQPEFENGPRLGFRKLAGAILAERMARVGNERDQGRHVTRGPGARHEGRAGRCWIRRSANQMDEFIDIGERDRKADLHMRGVARLGEQVLGAPCDNLFAEIDEGHEKILERQDFRAAAIQGDHVAGKTRLQRGEAPELVQDNIGERVAFDFDHDPHAVAVGFIAQIRDAFDAFLANKLGDFLDQGRFVDLIGNLGDDQRLALLAGFLDFDFRPGQHRAAPQHICGADPGPPQNITAGRKVGAGDDRH